jgi:hypothetical protein
MEKFGVECSSAGNAQKVQCALEGGGLTSIAENGEGAGVRLKKAQA